MTELEVGKKYWIRAEYKKLNEFNDFQHWFEVDGSLDGLVMLDDVSEVKETIPEREKVTIPKEVADWIEETKRFYNLYGAMGRIEDNLAPSGIMKWFDTNPTLTGEILARAWLDGYEIEKEQLYYVKIPNVFHGDLGYSKSLDNYSFYNKHHAFGMRFELTEKEIKQNHEWAWQFAVPVEEEE